MPSFFKTQWFRLLLGLVFLVIALIDAFMMPGATSEEIANMNFEEFNNYISETLRYLIPSIGAAGTAIIWILSSVVEYNAECIQYLEKKINALEEKKHD